MGHEDTLIYYRDDLYANWICDKCYHHGQGHAGAHMHSKQHQLEDCRREIEGALEVVPPPAGIRTDEGLCLDVV